MHSTMIQNLFSKMLDSNKKKKIFFTILATLMLYSKTSNATESVTNSDHIKDHDIVKSSCSVTLHPDICYSTISNVPEITKKVKSSKDVIEIAVNKTKEIVKRNYFTIKKLTLRTDLTKPEKIALYDCLEMVAETLYELNDVVGYLETYPTKKGIRQHVDDIITLMSTTITNQETCIDGFSRGKDDIDIITLLGTATTNHEPCRNIFLSQSKYKGDFHESLIDEEIHAEKLCSISLALIKNMTETDMVDQEKVNGRKLMNEEGVKWPGWLSVGDRRLLSLGTVTPNVVVAADGSGDFTTVSAAVAAAPSKSSTRYVIRIAAGTYRENVDIPLDKWNLMFLGSGVNSTIITGNRSCAIGYGTLHSATVAIVGAGFLAHNITFENTAGPSGYQAVALMVRSDLSAFYHCNILGYQDTLYVHSKRQFYKNCFISGTIDFIFGNAEVVFQDCDIHARQPKKDQKNMVTAQGRSDPNQNTGIIIQKSRIGATSDLRAVQRSFPTYLGRPWKQYSRTVVMQSMISDVIHPEGWFPWNVSNFALDTLYYGEYQNTGVGARTVDRVKWRGYRVITSIAEAQGFTAENFISGSKWLNDTGFPYDLGL